MEVKLIIPQREPIIMIDEIVNHSDVKTTTSLTINKTNIFVEENIFQSSGLIENMAQSSAARMGIQTNKEGNKPLLGYIASIKNLIVNRLPEVGEKILTEIIIVNKINNIIVIKAEGKVDNIIISSCELKVFIEE
jgi:3-hydroxyacyl-[acyl-carrier-protein] dehydratase|tara:strand:- start:2446 stop:2850 length:405 start_codon:yes stop_codon:yes gene_type:complete